MTSSYHYAERVRHVLLSAGVTGITQNELHQKSRTPKYDTNDLLILLEAWQKRKWVDKFADPNHVRRFYYRATQKLVDDWPTITRVVDQLIIGPTPLDS